MIKIKIYTVGKTKEAWLIAALKQYHDRLSHDMTLEWKIVKDLSLMKEKNYICLDPCGVQLTSPEFSTFLEKTAIEEGAKLTFVIGGPEGIPKGIRLKAKHLISFSKQIFTHQMVRLMLIEQLYRCIQIQKGTKYHK